MSQDNANHINPLGPVSQLNGHQHRTNTDVVDVDADTARAHVGDTAQTRDSAALAAAVRVVRSLRESGHHTAETANSPDPLQPTDARRPRPARRSRRRNKRVRKTAAVAGWSPEPAHPQPVTPAPRSVRRRVKWRDREGFYELRVDPALSTTRQGEVLNLALASAPTTHRRLLFGKDVITEQWVYLDPFLAYADPTAPDHVSDVGVAVLGDVGSGKSACIKAHFLMRTLLLGRYVVVLDKKLQGVEGEYAPIARLLGTEPVRFRLGGGGSRLNLLDPIIPTGLDLNDSPDTDQTDTPARASDAADNGAASSDGNTAAPGSAHPVGQLQLIRAVLREQMERRLDEHEGKALRVALTAAHSRAHAEARQTVLADLVWCLRHPHPQRDARRPLRKRPGAAHRPVRAYGDADLTVAELTAWGRPAAFALEDLLDGELFGLVNGPTSPEVRLDHPSRLTVFDISALPTEGPALAVVMLLVQTWLKSLLATRAALRQQTVMAVEEGWHVAAGSIGAMWQKNVKLSRGTGLSTVAGFHHPSDLPADSPARALLQEAGTLLIFRQGRPDDAAETVRLANLDPALTAQLTKLPTGQCIVVRKNQDPIWVKVARSRLETELTNTDAQLIGDTHLNP